MRSTGEHFPNLVVLCHGNMQWLHLRFAVYSPWGSYYYCNFEHVEGDRLNFIHKVLTDFKSPRDDLTQ